MTCSIFAMSSEFRWKDFIPKLVQVFLRLLSHLMVQVFVLYDIFTKTEAAEMADRAMLFKLSSKQLGTKQGIMPSFMAKPHPNLPGTSGHIHLSLIDEKTGRNLFARDNPDLQAEWADIKNLSDLGRHLYEPPRRSGLIIASPES
jgi:hypothetical protein